MANDANATTRGSLGLIPAQALKIDLTLNEAPVENVDDLLSDKIGRGVDGHDGISLRKLDGSTGTLQVITLR